MNLNCASFVLCLFPPLNLWLDEKDFTDDGNWPGQHMWKMQARPNGQAAVLLQTRAEGSEGPGGLRHLLNMSTLAAWCPCVVKAKDDSRKPKKEVSLSPLPLTPRSGNRVWAGVLSGQFTTQVSASCLQSRHFQVLTCSFWRKQLELLFCLSNSLPYSKAQSTGSQPQWHRGPISDTWCCPFGRGIQGLDLLKKCSQPNCKPCQHTWDTCMWIKSKWYPVQSSKNAEEKIRALPIWKVWTLV